MLTDTEVFLINDCEKKMGSWDVFNVLVKTARNVGTTKPQGLDTKFGTLRERILVFLFITDHFVP